MCKNREVTVKELQVIRNRSYNTCLKYMKDIRDYFGKQKHQVITVDNVAEYFGLPVNLIENILDNKKNS